MGKKKIDDNFIMSPKVDFTFKLLFGDPKHKDLLIALLSAVLGLPEEQFADIEIINTELLREFKEDKKGILDVRVRTKEGKQIDVEIQILPTEFMAERTIFYLAKMYTSQIKSGDTYDMLKKCITINIVDFPCTPLKKLHSKYHLTEDETGHRLTDVIEIHFLELSKLFDVEVPKNEDDVIVQWLEFIDGKSKGVMEMMAKKNESIKKAYDLLKVISKDEKARMLYDARNAEITDQLTRIKSAEEKGARNKALENADNFLKLGVDEETVAKGTGLSIEVVREIKSKIKH